MVAGMKPPGLDLADGLRNDGRTNAVAPDNRAGPGMAWEGQMDEGTRRVLIVDDHPIFREALVVALRTACPGALEANHAASLSAACEALDAGPVPELILLDLSMADASGLDGLLRISRLVPDVPVVVVSATEGAEAYQAVRALGAMGYLPKSLSLTELSGALSEVLAGRSWWPDADKDGQVPDDLPHVHRLALLTPAQRRVLDGLSDGLLNKQIAYDMGISEATVKAHMTAIFRKLNVTNRTQALLVMKMALDPGRHSAA